MTEKDFIINAIKELVVLFPNTSVRYENHVLSNTHFVEVLPNEFYHSNEAFQKWEEKVMFQFITLFPTQNLCFISEDALVGIENIDYEIKGKFFALQNTDKTERYLTAPVLNMGKHI